MNVKNVAGSIGLILLFIACNSPKTSRTAPEEIAFQEIPLSHAKGFKMYTSENYTRLLIENPWQQAENISFEYLLSADSLPRENVIHTPVHSVVCLSTTHVAYLSMLHQQEQITGLTNAKLVSDSLVVKQLANGKTRDVGNEQALNYENILSLNPDLIFAYGVGAEVQSVYQKFADWGIPVVIVAEYLEATPLAKAEWLKFFARFFDDSRKADSLFSHIETQYLFYADQVKHTRQKPAVMSSLPWKGVWYMPGGNSFMANFIRDAGGNYIYRDNHQRESLNLSIEQVMLDGQQAKIWIHTGMANALRDIENADVRLGKLPAFKNKQVYNNNKKQNFFGGNDFWESGVVQPHLILKDLIHIFHPQIMPDTGFYYYKKLN